MNRWLTILIYLSCFDISYLSAQEDKLIFLKEWPEAVDARINIIDNAKKELYISYFIFSDDEIGMYFMDKIIKKKEQIPDIDIKILLDASGNDIDRNLTFYLESKGIEIKEFHALPKLKVPQGKISIKNFIRGIQNFNMRMHDKLIIADSVVFITGGRNIENSYYGMDKRNFHDLDIYFYSKILTSNVRTYFLQLWNSKYVQKINYFKKQTNSRIFEKTRTLFVNYKANIQLRLSDIKYDYYLPVNNGIPFKKAYFLSCYDPSNDNYNPVYLSTSLYNMLSKIDNELIIETPYLLPTGNMYKLLSYLTNKGVKIEIITNSICSTDIMPIASAYDNQKYTLEQLKIDLHEFKGPDYMHTKSAEVDGKFAIIGSYNLDPRSANINTELVFIIEDSNVAAKLKEVIQIDKANSIKVEKSEFYTYGGYYGCEKSDKDMLMYMLFKILTSIRPLYNQF